MNFEAFYLQATRNKIDAAKLNFFKNTEFILGLSMFIKTQVVCNNKNPHISKLIPNDAKTPPVSTRLIKSV